MGGDYSVLRGAGKSVLLGLFWQFGPNLERKYSVFDDGRVRNSGERMSGRERTGADFYLPPWGGAFRSLPRTQNPGRQRELFFLILF